MTRSPRTLQPSAVQPPPPICRGLGGYEGAYHRQPSLDDVGAELAPVKFARIEYLYPKSVPTNDRVMLAVFAVLRLLNQYGPRGQWNLSGGERGDYIT